MAELVSIVIPVYNTGQVLESCVKTVLSQIYRDIEIILIDDGSTDSTASLCDALACLTGQVPVIVIHKKNSGVSSARNLGIDFADGKYIVFIDSDDSVTSDYVLDLMQAKKKYPDAGHIWCGFECFSQNNARYVYSENEPISIVSRDDYLELSEKVLVLSPWLRIFDKSVLEKNKIRMDEELSLAEDIIFNLDYLDAVDSKKICIINKPNYKYLDTNIESLKNKYRKDLPKIYEYYLSILKGYLNKWGINSQVSRAKYYSIVYLKYAEIMQNTFNSNNRDSYFKKIRRNNHVLRKEEFCWALQQMNIPIPSLLRKAYKTKNYFFVWIYEKFFSFHGR